MGNRISKSTVNKEDKGMIRPTLSSQEFHVADMEEAIEMYFEKGWTDGLPVVPPTVDKVQEYIEYAGKSPGEVLGEVPVRGRTITVEKVVINAVMAGCLPEYVPVVLAAVEAMCQEPYNLHGSSASTGGSATLLIVNGPIVKELGINSGVNLFGPGCRANATIGRALRLVLMNVCGATPGTLDRSTLGHPGKYSYCIAEDETDSPWEPYHVEKGFAAEVSTVTVLPALGPHQMSDSSSNSAEGVLASFASTLTAMGEYTPMSNHGLRFCVVVIGGEHRGVIAREGWTKKQVKQFLHQKARRSVAELKRWGMMPGVLENGDDENMVSAVSAADEIVMIAAGGGGTFSACIAPWAAGRATGPVTRMIAGTSR